MSSESNALLFLNLYLGPFLSQKSLDLLKLGLIKKARKKRAIDSTLSEVGLIREMIKLIKKRRKAILAQLDPTFIKDPAHLELLKLPPEDALLYCSGTLFPVPLRSISLALHIPEASLHHRNEQLRILFKDHPIQANLIGASATKTQEERRAQRKRSGIFTTFQSLPLALRFLIETTFVLTLLLGLLWIIPEVRNRYEASIQSRINEYLIESALVDAPAPEGTSKSAREVIPAESDPNPEEALTKSSSDAPSQKKQPKVNEGETWRFSFTGSATSEIEGAILEVLNHSKIEGAKPLNVPGGIQFDFVIEMDRLLNLKNQLETAVGEIQRKALSAQTSAIAYANMSWYKKRNMGTRKIPNSHVQVIIWISTL